MRGSARHTDRLLTAPEFFSRARQRLSFDVPEGFTDPDVIPRHDQLDADPALIAAIAAVRPVRTAAVLVPVIERDEPSVLFTLRTSRLADHGGQISFPGGKIDSSDATPAAAALREAEEEIALSRRFVDPIGYLDVHLTPFGHRIMPVLARVQPGFALPHAQRAACAAYVRSQASEGWVALAEHYDDGGFSGGTMERPALQRLLADIEAGQVDVVVVYKIDRLTRSLVDFARLVEVFDRNASPSSRHPVLQHHHQHGAADAQCAALLRAVRARGHRRAHPRQDRGLAQARHVDGRLRAARLRRQGPQAGGERGRGGDRAPHLRALRPDRLGDEAGRGELRARGRANKRGKPLDKGHLYKLLDNRVYLGRGGAQGHGLSRRARGDRRQDLWDKVHAILARKPARARPTRGRRPRRC